jgi:hypothetical protein
MAATTTEIEAATIVQRVIVLALAWKDLGKGGLTGALMNQYQPVIQALNGAQPPDTALIEAVQKEYKRMSAQLPKP